MADQQESRRVGLPHVYSFTGKLVPLLQFLYKEVPLEHRNPMMRAYQEWLELEAYKSNFFKGVCHERLVREIGYFFRPLIKGPLHPTQTDSYGKNKLANSHTAIEAIAKELAPNWDLAPEHRANLDLEPQQRYSSIQVILDDVLAQPHLKEGDVALLKFYRALVDFASEEMRVGNPLPIPATLSFAFARVLAIAFSEPITISFPDFDDRSEWEHLQEVIRGLPKYQ